jgi:hypothetical protein
MTKTLALAMVALAAIITSYPAQASTQRTITGDSAQEVQENAFKQGFDYPVSELRCNQRCSQRWERQ